MPDKKPSSELITAEEGESFSRWDLPSFSESVDETAAQSVADADVDIEPEVRVEEVTIEDVKPLTLDEVEAIRQDAWNEGFSTGEKDGFHAGQLKAAQEAEVVLQGKVQALENIMQQFFAPIANQDQQLEEMMLELVMQISRQVIQRELSIDSSQIKQIVREALKLLPMGSEAVRVYINPQDFEQIKALRERHEENWKIIEDDDLLPGGCRFESANTQINATIETRLEHIAAQILEQQRELKSHPLDADLQIALDAPSDSTLAAAKDAESVTGTAAQAATATPLDVAAAATEPADKASAVAADDSQSQHN
ncbi:MAG: flagellar assembly protein FliH [Gammaproteobacteria bacterium]|nr:flagellar assembly protein FliH [Gammaproteobacteria bacterium]